MAKGAEKIRRCRGCGRDMPTSWPDLNLSHNKGSTSGEEAFGKLNIRDFCII
jgi:hypothetical protein